MLTSDRPALVRCCVAFAVLLTAASGALVAGEWDVEILVRVGDVIDGKP